LKQQQVVDSAKKNQEILEARAAPANLIRTEDILRLQAEAKAEEDQHRGELKN